MQHRPHLHVDDHLLVGLTGSVGADALHVEASAAVAPLRPRSAEAQLGQGSCGMVGLASHAEARCLTLLECVRSGVLVWQAGLLHAAVLS